MRRWLFRIVLLLIIGAVINVAIAWGLAVRPYSPARTRDAVAGWTGQDYIIHILRDFGGEVQTVEIRMITAPYEMRAVSNDEFQALLPGWSQLRDRQMEHGHYGTTFFSEFATGWPMLSLVRFQWRTPDNPIEDRGRLLVPNSWLMQSAATRALANRRRNELPLIPIWPGFYVNTLLYACAAWLVFFAPFRALRFTKHAHRRRKGLCLRCGYDLRGATTETCPECGAARTAV